MDTNTNMKDAEKDAKVVKDGATRSMSIDDELLEQLGHVSGLRRKFSVWSLGSLCLCLMATWETISSVFATALTNGGAPCLFYNYFISNRFNSPRQTADKGNHEQHYIVRGHDRCRQLS